MNTIQEIDAQIKQALSPVQRWCQGIWSKKRYRIPMCLMLIIFAPFYAVAGAWAACGGFWDTPRDLIGLILLVALSCFMVVFGIKNFNYKG